MPRSLGLSLYLALTERQRAHRPPMAEPARPEGPLVWMHATTAAQARAFGELIQRMQEDWSGVWFLMSYSTPDIEAAIDSMPPTDRLILKPLEADDPGLVDQWQPDATVWTSAPSHPAILARLADRQRPLVLADIEADLPSLPIKPRIPGLRRGLLACFDKLLVRDMPSGRRLNALGLGADRVEVVGQMQEGAIPLPCDDAERDTLAAKLSNRKIWFAANCTTAECEIAFRAHGQAMRSSHSLLLVLTPDDSLEPARVAELGEECGLRIARRSLGEMPDESTNALIADVEGEFGLWYRLAPISLIGQSFADGGASTPNDAAALGSAVLLGPRGVQAGSPGARLEAAGAARVVRDEDELAHAIELLLSPDKPALMAHNAWVALSGGSLVLDRIAELLEDALDSAEVRNAGT